MSEQVVKKPISDYDIPDSVKKVVKDSILLKNPPDDLIRTNWKTAIIKQERDFGFFRYLPSNKEIKRYYLNAIFTTNDKNPPNITECSHDDFVIVTTKKERTSKREQFGDEKVILVDESLQFPRKIIEEKNSDNKVLSVFPNFNDDEGIIKDSLENPYITKDIKKLIKKIKNDFSQFSKLILDRISIVKNFELKSLTLEIRGKLDIIIGKNDNQFEKIQLRKIIDLIS